MVGEQFDKIIVVEFENNWDDDDDGTNRTSGRHLEFRSFEFYLLDFSCCPNVL